MRDKSKPNCRARQLGPREMPFTRRYQKQTTQVFIVEASVIDVKNYDMFTNNGGAT